MLDSLFLKERKRAQGDAPFSLFIGGGKMAKTNNNVKKRALSAVAVLLLVGFGANVVKLFGIQVIKSEEYKAKAEAQQFSDTVVEADRGTIYDTNMNILAESASAWLVFVDPSRIEDDAQRKLIADGLSGILKDIKSETVYEKIGNKDYRYVKIAGKVEYKEKTAIQEFIDNNDLYGTVNIDPDTKRYYPYSNFASTLIGFTGSDNTGRAGLELQYNDSLTGIAGRIITAKKANNDLMSSNYETKFDAKQGLSHVLTIDKNIQHYLESSLANAVVEAKATAAYGIVMQVKTGAILGMATMPDYDLNNPTVITDKTVLSELDKIKDEEKYDAAYNERIYNMWRNKAISDTYEPGSVFKVVTASAVVEENILPEGYTYTCEGAIQVADNMIGCHNRAGHGVETLQDGLMNSCNPFFITMGQLLGSERWYKYFEAFGFTEKTNIDLPGEAQPKGDVTYYTLPNLGIAELSSCAFGQSFQVSAIQMITAVSCVANGGKLMQPYLVAKELDQDGNVVYEAKPTVRRQVISESTAKTVIAMMEQVVADGTGCNAYIPGCRIAGKTGTSEKLTSPGENIASFCGCAPANDPEIAVLIVVDEPHGNLVMGGTLAAPIAGSVIEQCLKYLNIEPMYTDEEMAQLNAETPDVNGISVQAAKSKLSGEGFTARVVGSGDKVLSQYPARGQSVPVGGVVILYTEAGTEDSGGTVPSLTGLSMSEANERAVNSGFNIKISGATGGVDLVSYKQSIEAGTKAEYGTTITVYFSTTTGVND